MIKYNENNNSNNDIINKSISNCNPSCLYSE